MTGRASIVGVVARLLGVAPSEDIVLEMDGAKAGDVLTVQDDGSIAPAPQQGGGGGGVIELTSSDNSVTITDPTGPAADLSVPTGASVQMREVVLTDASWDVAGSTGAWTVVGGLLTCTANGLIALLDTFDAQAWGLVCEADFDATAAGEFSIRVDDDAASLGTGKWSKGVDIYAPVGAGGVNLSSVGLSAASSWNPPDTTGFVPIKLSASEMVPHGLVNGSPPPTGSHVVPPVFVGIIGPGTGAVSLAVAGLAGGESLAVRGVRLFVLDPPCLPDPV